MHFQQSNDLPYVGVDFGGTTIAAGLVRGGEIIALHTVPTRRERSPEAILDTIVEAVREVADGSAPGGVGIGVPCPSGPGVDRLTMIENLPAMEGYPFRPLAEKRLELPVVLENDAKCMVMGEYRSGALQGCRHGVCVTLGTGLGCGVIIDGRIYRGAGSYSGEIWNIPYGECGTLEESVSIAALKCLVRELTGEETEPHELFTRFQSGDPAAAKVFGRYGERVGRVMVMLLSVLDPDRIALGGGLSRAFDAFRGSMRSVVETTWGVSGADRIVPAELSDRAAVLGAAEAARIGTGG